MWSDVFHKMLNWRGEMQTLGTVAAGSMLVLCMAFVVHAEDPPSGSPKKGTRSLEDFENRPSDSPIQSGSPKKYEGPPRDFEIGQINPPVRSGSPIKKDSNSR